MEYRKPGKQYSDELDTKIYGEGMVVYRINTAVQGNYRGDTDGIYVFRPGETALNAGQGDLTRSCYGGTNAPDSIGTTDLTKTFQDGALVYSDGTNSGIALDDIQIQPDGTLTFSASFADVSDRQLWQSVCDVPTSQELQSYDMCTGSDGSVYLASASDSGTVLYRLDGDTLTPVSTAISGSVYNPKLAFAGNTPYLLYQDDQYLLRLCRWNGTVWETCYTGTELAQYADMTASGGKLYLTYTTGTFPYALQAACYDTATDTLSALGSTIAANACNMEIAVSGETILIGYRDLDDNGVPKAAVWNGSSWNSTALSDQDCGMVSVLADGEDIWIAPSGGKTDLYRWTDGAVISYPLPDTAKDRAFQLVPAAADGGFYLAVNAQSPGEFLLCELDQDGTDLDTGRKSHRTGDGEPAGSGGGRPYHLLSLHHIRLENRIQKADAFHSRTACCRRHQRRRQNRSCRFTALTALPAGQRRTASRPGKGGRYFPGRQCQRTRSGTAAANDRGSISHGTERNIVPR